MPTTFVSAAGSMAREIDDLILLDSIVRMPNITTTGHGMIPQPVSCAAPITNINLNGTRIGLPSTFGWVTGMSGEVWFMIGYPLGSEAKCSVQRYSSEMAVSDKHNLLKKKCMQHIQ